MQSKRDLLDLLKAEMKFLEEGGYRHPVRNDWRAQFIFEDSPVCLNYGAPAERLATCSTCALMAIVPPELRTAKWPCRQIPLNRAGETLDSLYRTAEASEIEVIVRQWLRQQIHRLEDETTATREGATSG